jgi:aldehyde dehydrogenase (NAD+)
VQAASEQDVDKAVAAAKAAFKGWRSTPSGQRSAIMLKFADLVEKHTEEIAKLESFAMGHPISISKVLVQLQVAGWRYYAGLTDKIPGETYPVNGDGIFKMVNYEPLGVCAGIAAWNATQLFVAWKVSFV